jgi:hypothetical protein
MNTESLNLLPPRRRTELRLRHRFHLWTLGSVVYGVVTLGACIALAAGEPVVDLRETRELSNLAREKEMFDDLKKQYTASMVEERRRKEGADLVADHPDWSILLDLLADNRGDDAVIVGVDVQPDVASAKGSDAKPRVREAKAKGDKDVMDKAETRPDAYTIRIEGFASTQTAVAEFADRIQRIGVFGSVTLQRSSTRLLEQRPVVDFIVICRLEATMPKGDQ